MVSLLELPACPAMKLATCVTLMEESVVLFRAGPAPPWRFAPWQPEQLAAKRAAASVAGGGVVVGGEVADGGTVGGTGGVAECPMTLISRAMS